MNTEKQQVDPYIVSLIVKTTTNIPWLKQVLQEYIELVNFCQNIKEVTLINKLLEQFMIVDTTRLAQIGKDLAKAITSEYGFSSQDTVLYTFSDSDDTDGSKSFLYSLKNKFDIDDGWSEKHFISNIKKINEHNRKYKNIILVDDFIGTGNTTIRKVNYCRKVLEKLGIKQYRILVICIAAMDFSRVSLEIAGVEVKCGVWLKKGIGELLPSSESADNYQTMKELESRLDQERNKSYFPFGYGQSEALYSLEGQNTPNNVFPIFWYSYTISGKRSTILKALRK
jgi:hypothetical protein